MKVNRKSKRANDKIDFVQGKKRDTFQSRDQYVKLVKV